MTQVLIEIELDEFPWQTSWRIKDVATNLVFSVVSAFTDSLPGSTQKVLVTLPLDDSFKLMLRDSVADGFDGKLAVYLGDTVDPTKLLAFFDGSRASFVNLKRINFVAGTSGIIAPPPPPGPMVHVVVSLTLDGFPSETSWFIKDRATNTIVNGATSNGEYSSNQEYDTIETTVSLPAGGQYKFVLKDSYGDGLYGTVDLYLGSSGGTVLGQFDGIADYSWFNSKRIRFST
jgi:hypothetical protein